MREALPRFVLWGTSLFRDLRERWIRERAHEGFRLALSFGIFGAVLLFHAFGVFERFELVTYDTRCLLKGTPPADSRIVVIEISDDSVAKIGRWPWDRSWHAALIEALSELGAKAVVFDVIFSEKSDPIKDITLTQAIQRAGNVYLAEVIQPPSQFNEMRVLASRPEFAALAKGTGHINLMPDRDGVMRRVPLLIESSGKKIPNIALKVFLDQYGVRTQNVVLTPDRLVIPLRGQPIVVPLDGQKNFMIRWIGKWQNTFQHFSYIDVISSYAVYKKGGEPHISPDVFRGKICFVGTSAAGLFDIRPTPLEPAYPAVGVNLTILNNLLERQFIRVLSARQTVFLLFLLFVLMFAVMRLKSFFRCALFTTLLAVGYLVAAFVVFITDGLWLPLVYPLILILTTYFFITVHNQLSVTLERAKLLRLATRDSLTGLYNIGHFKLLLKAEMASLSIRREKKLSILMGDIDHFKEVNDAHGHLAGDMVLRETAVVIRSHCRALDVAARYGGEEFIVMLPGADAEEASRLAEKIRKTIGQKGFVQDHRLFEVTISLGITQASPRDKNIEEAIARADRALYTAKQTGRNKVVVEKSP